MGRPAKELNEALMIDLLADGMTKKDVADILGVSPPTIANRIEDLKKRESSLLAYDKVHHLDLIDVKQRIVAGVTNDKIAEAPLAHLANAYGVFAKHEQLIQGRPTEIHGLMGYLLHLEKEDIEAKQSNSSSNDDDVIDGECVDG